MEELSQVMPAVALRGATILPGMIVHFDISRKKSIAAVENAMHQDQDVFLITQKNPDLMNPAAGDLYEIGTVAAIRQIVRMPKEIIRVMVEGKHRARLNGFDDSETEYLLANITSYCDDNYSCLTRNEDKVMTETIRELFESYVSCSKNISQDLAKQILESETLAKLVDQISINLPIDYKERQAVLDALEIGERAQALGFLLSKEVEMQKFRLEIQGKIKAEIDQNQKEYILREQLKVIREELGEDNTRAELDEYRKKVSELKCSDEVREKLFSEIRRLENNLNNPSESSVSRSYIETLLKMPWDKMSRDKKDLAGTQKILNEDHYGMEKVKERILEYLAVRTLTKKGEAPILCLYGPPGTGKTSIAHSVARALNKQYVRICLGGVHDEAEIRGHRRTYIGSMPGRIVQGLIHAGVKNPLMLLDEVDKVSADYRGDTSSALLEVLDSEQNSHFEDHYVDLPVDLSEVFFLATANDISRIPKPLLDRMEILELSGYTDNEKMHIAREHLVEKQKKVNGIPITRLTISDDALERIITGYTREAGVRSLERCIGQICRKAARMLLEEKKKKVAVTAENLEDFLGRQKFYPDMANEKPEIGIVRGLAWTSVGGETLEVEVNVMPGKGAVVLTGQLGDVMKESAHAGISYIRSQSEKFEIPADFFEKHDIHIHIPEGAVPKDGPSAGITMALACVSAIRRIPVRADLAMTGEVTLRGRVLPIGGLKEKLLAAKKAGISEVLVPEKNRPDVEELDAEITDGLTITFVEHMDQVLDRALVKEENQVPDQIRVKEGEA